MLNFTKYHGLGNDFIIIEDLSLDVSLTAAQIAEMCRRRFGIGADGLILVRPSELADFEMAYFNADGSIGEMCGNGIRCMAKYIADKSLSDLDTLNIETGAGTKTVSLIKEHGTVTAARVDMGEPVFTPGLVPVLTEKEEFIDEPIEVEDKILIATAVSMGNPHCVIFVEAIDAIPVAKVGAYIENIDLFPRKTNVEFVEVIDESEVMVHVWERGVGQTLACGTGACAVVAAGVKTGLLGRDVTVRLEGGDLRVEWLEGGPMMMTGPAEKVFEGTIRIDE